MNRECGEDLDLNGIQLRAGDIIALPIYAIQHSEDFYPEPEKFMPERWE
jgi:cytochrome P450